MQFEAVGRATELFPNLVRANVVRPNMVRQAAEIADEDEPEDADEDAHWAGQGFLEVGGEREWEGWCNWDTLE